MNDLLEKYWNGATSLQEEQQLRDYFAGDSVARSHEVYRSLFNSFELESRLEDGDYDAFAKVKSKQSQDHIFNRRTWKGIAIAASMAVAVAVGTGYFETQQQQDLGTYETPEEAYEATVAALEMVSARINKGKSTLQPMKEINQQAAPVIQLAQK
ncbi:hypothetical protein [Nonlabens ponticola]|uniref:Pyruvate ferredoxin oxidoreductase n=1 Tax=Nonlabens ponticola TaxID=2496866 RepID=A0A3S9MY08_9FLAO|nr:hypothetical protein [Nonlabens ponticola]AZQ44156.1 hypothetical protein EJ995_07895 [Nonlabens ponticola]